MHATNVETFITETIDTIDRAIIHETQAGLPLVEQPYLVIAAKLNISHSECLRRLLSLQNKGIIRRIGIIPNHYRLGFKANGMSVWNVPDKHVTELGQLIGAMDCVSHCYRRPRFLPEWPYNLFAMVHGKNRDEVMHMITSISEQLGKYNHGHEVLFSKRILKKAGLRLTPNGNITRRQPCLE